MREYIIKSATETRLIAHGLILDMDYDHSPISPRDYASSVFVGGEVNVPSYIERGDCFEDFVRNYCREELNCKPSDLVWAQVSKYEHGSVDYFIGQPSCKWDGSIVGFIYETKENLRKEYGVKRISKKISDQITAYFSGEMEYYTRWANGDIYQITVSGADDYLSDSLSGVDNCADHVDNTVNEYIDNILYSVDKYAKVVNITISANELEVPTDDPVLSVVLPLIEDKFYFVPTVGKMTIDEDTGQISFNVPLESLPSILTIAAECDTDNVFDAMQEMVKVLNKDGQYPQISSNEVVTHITDNEGYECLPAIMKAAIVSVLFSSIEGVSVVSVADVSTESEPA